MKRYYFLLIALTAISYTSCTKLDDSAQETPDPLKEINLTDTLTMYAGNVIQINYTISPASYDTSKLVWSSADTSVLAVTNSGKISAKKEGVSTISVTNEAKTVSVNCHVTVKDSLSVGLLAFYPFNNSAQDLSGHNYNGETNNVTAVADRFGAANNAYFFNGTSSYIMVKDNPALRLADKDFTITNWIKLDDYNESFGSQVIDKRGYGRDAGWNISITGNDFFNTGQGELGLLTFNEGSNDLTKLSTNVVSLSSWHMITTTYVFSTHKISFYIDGVLDAAFDNFNSPNKSIDADIYIGRDNPTVTGQYYLKGTLDDLRIYKRALTVKEISRLYHSNH